LLLCFLFFFIYILFYFFIFFYLYFFNLFFLFLIFYYLIFFFYYFFFILFIFKWIWRNSSRSSISWSYVGLQKPLVAATFYVEFITSLSRFGIVGTSRSHPVTAISACDRLGNTSPCFSSNGVESKTSYARTHDAAHRNPRWSFMFRILFSPSHLNNCIRAF